ncbi:helix-turn-helix domain-containing protein [Streptomyces silvisoli]|uniref:Helix-turn-helix transcriptional regulator n=1 Tax=Streptomyces silvisoli TaxID=3034235 RepID=A0ABT5ZTH0_9ACTN|nr:helix-turn-helix transcriptional regulator [Streptomyces silvisoli]MDF3293127.1 helix-turn-helix transcriptional regulator [Streptomyces silvisoli]
MKPMKNATPERLVGAQVALFRRWARLTQRELAERLGVHEETIASIEQGRRPLKLDLAEQLDELLETKGALEVAVRNLPERAKYPVWAEAFIDHERDAIAISSYENQVIPGLLQTEAYARAVFRNRVPLFSEGEIEHRVAMRMERHDILHRKVPPTCSFIFSEAVLKDRLGGDEVYKEQLRHLRKCADLPGLTIQIMPLGRETHAGLNGPFVLLETPEHHLIVYLETQRGSQLISDPDEVSIIARKYAMLRSQALNLEESKRLLDQLLGER